MSSEHVHVERTGTQHEHDNAEIPMSRKDSLDEKTIQHEPSSEGFKDDMKAEHMATKAPISQPGPSEDEFPDGGLRAWLVVFGVSTTTKMLWACA